MQPEYPSQQPPPQYPYPPPPQRSGMPVWAWILVGCAGAGCLCIVVLAAIMVPVFSRAREKARQTSCLSNIKQTSLGMIMYLQDYDEQYPPTAAWKDYTYPYTKAEYLYHCPSVKPRSTSADDPYGYAFNSKLINLNFAKVEDPRTTLMIFESSNLSKNASDAGESLPSPGRHLGVNNLGFADGHAKAGNKITGGDSP